MQSTLRPRSALYVDRIAVVLAVHRDRGREANGGDARHSGHTFSDALERARSPLVVADERWRYRDDERLNILWANETRVDLAHRDERPNHQPRDDQERQSQCDLPYDERMSSAVPCWSIARRSASFFHRHHVRAAESEDGKKAE